MIIISWDVGIHNLAYCVMEKQPASVNIIDWGVIDIAKTPAHEICGCNMKSGKKCTKKATHVLCTPKCSYYYCRVHLNNAELPWCQNDTEMMFFSALANSKCEYRKRDATLCNRAAKYHNQINLCTSHYQAQLKQDIAKYSPMLITKPKQLPTDVLQYNMIEILDGMAGTFAGYGIQHCVIENQPSQKNPKMKSIANTLFDYFVIRGKIDHRDGLNIATVRYMNACNKLKLNNDNTVAVMQQSRDDAHKYKLTKELGITYTSKMIAHDKKWLDYLQTHAKKDDLCDAYLQGRYYLDVVCEPAVKKVGAKKAGAKAGTKIDAAIKPAVKKSTKRTVI